MKEGREKRSGARLSKLWEFCKRGPQKMKIKFRPHNRIDRIEHKTEAVDPYGSLSLLFQLRTRTIFTRAGKWIGSGRVRVLIEFKRVENLSI